MKRWIAITLAIVPAGLVMGLMGARMVEPGSMRTEQIAGRDAAERGANARADEGSPFALPDPEARQRAQDRSRGRPDLDWDEEFWPEDHMGIAAGPYSYDNDYFGRRSPGAEDDDALVPRTGDDDARLVREARSAARAADSAVSDAVRARRSAAPSAAPPASRAAAPGLGSPPALPLPSEPRTADGDLPAIW